MHIIILFQFHNNFIICIFLFIGWVNLGRSSSLYICVFYRIFLHCVYEIFCQLISKYELFDLTIKVTQSIQKTVQIFLMKLWIELPYNLQSHSTKSVSQRDVCICVFTAAYPQEPRPRNKPHASDRFRHLRCYIQWDVIQQEKSQKEKKRRRRRKKILPVGQIHRILC